MAEPLTFDALASSEYVLSTAENYVLYVLLEAIATGAAEAVATVCRSIWASCSTARARCTTSGGSSS